MYQPAVVGDMQMKGVGYTQIEAKSVVREALMEGKLVVRDIHIEGQSVAEYVWESYFMKWYLQVKHMLIYHLVTSFV